ncbi:MAG: multidrug resistance efflux pump [Mariniblastus sp.]|jgi:multidrug resistance efflux pump
MIVFLTIFYVGLLLLLVKLNIIKLNTFWKLSPILWMAGLFLFLFVPLQWGAPAGNANVYQMIVEIVPNVSGEVVEVPVKGMQPLKRGDVLFKIDPEPFQIQVDVAITGLEDAQQKVKQLEAATDSADSVVKNTEQGIEVMKVEEHNTVAAIATAEATVREAEAKTERAESMVVDLRFQVETAERELRRMEGLLANSAVSESEVDRTKIQVTGLQAQLSTTTIDVTVANETVVKSKANLDVAQTNAKVLELRLKQLIETELPRVKFNAIQARLASNAKIGGQPTLIASAELALQQARFNLEQTTVRAPADGYAIGVTLRPGQRVGNLPLRSWISFVNDEATEIAVGISQNAMRNVKVGQSAEVTFKMYPGKVFSAKVDRIATVNSQGQLAASGMVPNAPGAMQSALPYGVVLKLDENSEIDVSRLPGGSAGTAAIYTDNVKFAHVMRKIMIRMQAWQNYVLP